MRERKRNSVEVYSGVCSPHRTQMMQIIWLIIICLNILLDLSNFQNFLISFLNQKTKIQ